MKQANNLVWISIFVLLIIASNIHVKSDAVSWEYIFTEEFNKGDKIEWEIETLYYNDEFLDTLNINETEDDILSLNVIQHPNKVVAYTEFYEPEPKSIPSYYFEEMPYETYLNNEEITYCSLYFIPDWRNYTYLIAPYYFRNNTHEFNLIYQECFDWQNGEQNWTYSGGYVETHLNYTYWIDSLTETHTLYAMDDNSDLHITVVENYEYNYQFYGIDINRTVSGTTTYAAIRDAKTGFLQEYEVQRNGTLLFLFEDFLDFDIDITEVTFHMKFIGITSGADLTLLFPLSTVALAILVVLRRKKRNET